MPDTTGPQSAQQTTVKPPEIRSILSYERPSSTDPNELIENRFLCRSGGALLIGATGVGKSSLALQMAISWALGRECFGFRPRWKLRSIFLQAENDDGDIAESRDGMFECLRLTGEEREEVGRSLWLRQETTEAGDGFWTKCVEPIVKGNRPELVWVDHALAYLGADARLQAEVGGWLRRHCTPLMHRFAFSPFIIHHTNKPPPNGKTSVANERDYSYFGSGTIEWPGWARAVITLTEVGNKVFELRAPKRGERLRWPHPCRYIRHSQNKELIFWEEAPAQLTPKQKEIVERRAALKVLLPAKGYSYKDWKHAADSSWGVSKSSFLQDVKALHNDGEVALSDGLWVPTPNTDIFAKYRKEQNT